MTLASKDSTASYNTQTHHHNRGRAWHMSHRPQNTDPADGLSDLAFILHQREKQHENGLWRVKNAAIIYYPPCPFVHGTRRGGLPCALRTRTATRPGLTMNINIQHDRTQTPGTHDYIYTKKPLLNETVNLQRKRHKIDAPSP